MTRSCNLAALFPDSLAPRREALGGELLLAFERDEFRFALADGNTITGTFDGERR